jgi:hypothetical protein
MGKGRRFCVLLVAVLLALLSGPCAALGLGNPVVRSRTGEPLYVSIPLRCQPEECEHVEVALLGVDDYRAAGIDYPELGDSISLSFDAAADALTVRTAMPVIKPAVHLLIQIRSGTLSMQQDIAVQLLAPGSAALEDMPAAPAAPKLSIVATAASAAPAEGGPAAAVSPPAPPAPQSGAKPVQAAAAAPRPAAQDEWTSMVLTVKQSLARLDPQTVATGVGIGIGLLLAWLMLRALRKALRGVWGTISHAIGDWRYRRAARKRDAMTLRAAPIEGAPLVRHAPPPPSAARPRAAVTGQVQAPAQPAKGPPARRRIDEREDQVVRTLLRQSAAEPERIDLRLKLLERLFEVQDRERFAEEARAVQPVLSQKGWERVRLMGKQLSPYDELFLNLDKESDVVVPVPVMKANY